MPHLFPAITANDRVEENPTIWSKFDRFWAQKRTDLVVGPEQGRNVGGKGARWVLPLTPNARQPEDVRGAD
jgi:hypothetical protein